MRGQWEPGYERWSPSAPGGEWSIVDSLAAGTPTSFASIESALSKPVANSIDMTRLGGLFALTLSLTLSIGCWEEIRYEPAPEVVQSSTAEQGVSPQETVGNAGPEAAGVPAEPTIVEPATVAEAATDSVAEPTTPPLDAPPLELPQSPGPEEIAPATAEPAAPTAESAPTDGLFGDASTDSAAPAVEAPAATPAQRRLIWQAAGKWSLAAAMFAKQLPAERFEPMQKEADASAAELGVALPSLPTPAAGQTPEQAVVATLNGEPTANLIATTAERFGAEAGALADLAIRTNLLLLTYSPRRDDVAAEAAQLRSIAESSGLPNDAWTPLAKLLEEGAEYVAVRTAIFDLHRRVETLLSEASR